MRKIVDFIYIASGTKFYFDWLLITNPISKNPLIRFAWGWNKDAYTAKDPKDRLSAAYALGSVHLIMGLASFLGGGMDSLTGQGINMLFNGYPILVQLYIGWRCSRLVKRKELRNAGRSQ